MLELGVTFDFGQMVMDNEMVGMIRHFLAGVPVTDETLAVDAIHEVGIGKDFLSHPTTLQHMRSHSQPKLYDRKMREDWTAEGAKDAYTRALETARHILETHQVDPLDESVLDELRAVVEESEAALGATPAESRPAAKE